MRASRSAKARLLHEIPLFSRCTKKELAALALVADELDVPAGRELTRQGEPGREFMVLVSGAADVVKNGRRVARLGSGDFLGEVALLTGGPRTATVTTTAPTTLLVLTQRAFGRVADEVPSVRASLLAALAVRLSEQAL